MSNISKILIVSRSFYPVNSPRSFRATELAKELAAQGHKVTVITPKNRAHTEFERMHYITIKDLPNYDETKFQIKKGNSGLTGKVLNRIKEQFLHYPQILIKDLIAEALKAEENQNYDLLISIAAPHPVHWGVSKGLKKHKNITKCWVADCGDPFMLSHNMQFKYPFYFKYFEKDFCRNADFITIPTESAKDGYYKEFHHKLRVIPQGFNFDEVRISDKTPSGNVLEFGYAGSLVPNRRDPSELLNYLKENKVEFRFIIYSKNRSFVERLMKKFPGQVIYKGEADRLDLLHHLSELDFVLNFENLGTNQTPSKLIDYAIIKKPILSIKYGNLDTRVVNEFIKRDYRSQLKVENVDRYRIENIAGNFLKLIQ